MNLPKFKNQKFFSQAFTHRSYLNEVREKIESNERLEFLGDSILSFVVSQHLFKEYPNFNEGTLTNLRSLLVNTKSLAEIAKQLNFGNFLRLSKGEEESKGRENQSLLADCFEAFIGALFLDQGIKKVQSFLLEILLPKAEDYVKKQTFKDPKSLLQEHIQSKRLSSPIYKVLKEEGPAHSKVFTVGVFVHDSMLGEGCGKSKQEAEESAAKKALERVKKEWYNNNTMIVIRLTRTGKKGERRYRVVVKEKRSKRDGKAIEILGSYQKTERFEKKELNKERIKYWLSCGAIPSATVKNLIEK